MAEIPMSKILIVDDDASLLAAFEQILAEQGHQVRTAVRGEEALVCIQQDKPELVVMDIRMPGMAGLEVLRRIRAQDRRLPVIIMTGYATAETAIEATQLGAFDYHIKPLEPVDILHSIDAALERGQMMTRRVEFDSDVDQSADDMIIGQSRGMREVFKAVGRVAATDASVLLRGETGTGKELVARAIYQHSLRAGGPLVVVNCVAIPETLLESEFFGHERGSFTGAEKRRIGKFEQADGGTLFLDEIGDMPVGLQAKLLRVLQDGKFERVGGSETVRVNVRILAATHCNLEADVKKGRFREDLYHRLRVFTIDLPPLRERKEDIPSLSQYFIRKYALELGSEPQVLSSEAMELLCAYPWNGNVRELQHAIQRLLIQAGGYPIHPDDIKRALENVSGLPSAGRESAQGEDALRKLIENYIQTQPGEELFSRFMETVEKNLIEASLRLTKGNQTHAAKLLGMPRPTLKSKIDKYGLVEE